MQYWKRTNSVQDRADGSGTDRRTWESWEYQRPATEDKDERWTSCGPMHLRSGTNEDAKSKYYIKILSLCYLTSKAQQQLFWVHFTTRKGCDRIYRFATQIHVGEFAGRKIVTMSFRPLFFYSFTVKCLNLNLAGCSLSFYSSLACVRWILSIFPRAFSSSKMA